MATVIAKHYDIIKRPIITEKSMSLKEQFNKYTFAVDPKANKIEIKEAVEAIFNVKVLSVNTLNVSGKAKRMGKYEGTTSAYKKAIVELAEGQTIEAFNID
jgi:large subunit ribosomal protein L23